MAHVRHLRDVGRLAAYALSRGATTETPGVVLWKASGGCTDPFTFTLTGKPIAWGQATEFQRNAPVETHYLNDGIDRAAAIWLDIEAPCRRCEQCLRRRAASWARRARTELGRAQRTWFATFTLDPEQHFLKECAAAVRLGETSVSWNDLDEEQQFLERHREISRDFTLYLKRVRKESGALLRYVLVAEAHKSGLPHYHALIHEVVGTRPVKERTLRKQWLLGFSSFSLVKDDQKSARYVAKYLSKAALARVRASVGYGQSL